MVTHNPLGISSLYILYYNDKMGYKKKKENGGGWGGTIKSNHDRYAHCRYSPLPLLDVWGGGAGEIGSRGTKAGPRAFSAAPEPQISEPPEGGAVPRSAGRSNAGRHSGERAASTPPLRCSARAHPRGLRGLSPARMRRAEVNTQFPPLPRPRRFPTQSRLRTRPPSPRTCALPRGRPSPSPGPLAHAH